MTKTSKQKKRSAIIAAVLAVAILLTGTYAWQSISQEAKNETLTAVSVGGRLHDDFDGTNKDVYVENFNDPENHGAPILARIRLDEYMETGTEAGMNRTKDDGSGNTINRPMNERKVTPLVAGTDINDESTWTIHKPAGTPAEVEKCAEKFHDYWTWTLGGQTTFMPTFNKDKDSLKADMNGTLEGPDGEVTTASGDDRYQDYVDYSIPTNATKKADAWYDADDDKNEDTHDQTGINGGHVTKEEETHTAKLTQDGTVISMADWVSGGKKLGQYWVYDTDGWAYWAMPIQPGEATGLLLDQIEMTGRTDEDCYYAINVVGQFASLEDYGKSDSTGFFDTANGATPTTEAAELLDKIATTKAVVTVSADGGAASVSGGTTQKFSGTIFYDGQDVTAMDTLTWTVKGASSEKTTIDATGNLTVAKAEVATKLTVKAESKLYGTVGTFEIPVNRTFLGEIAVVKAGTTESVNVDGVDWYVLVNEKGKKALLWSKEMIPASKCEWGTGGKGAFGTTETTNHWVTSVADGSKSSTARTWCNSTFLQTLTDLKTVVMDTTLKTREQINSTNFIESTDKVFFLSEADLFGTFNWKDKNDAVYPVQADDYTYAPGGIGKVLVSDVNMRKCNSTPDIWYWLRSPANRTNFVATGTSTDGILNSGGYTYGGLAVRPALWVNLDL